MTERYILTNIRTLLTEGFTAEELRVFCHDHAEFRPLYHHLSERASLSDIVQELIAFAVRQELVEPLLAWARQQNAAKYQLHQPYETARRILLVDDSEDWRKQVGSLLQEQQPTYEVVAVGSRDEAIRRIVAGEVYDLALIDMRLDEEDEDNREGVDLGWWLRNNGYRWPIIMMTAYTIEAEVARSATLRPFQFVMVEKGKIGSGGVEDLLRQIELALS